MDETTFDQRQQQVEKQYNADTIHIYEQAGNAPPPLPLTGRLLGGIPQRNPFFTGREDELARLHTALHTGNAALTPVPQALQGLGGIGKTQTAIEYVYRCRNEYEGVFWTVGETPAQLAPLLAALASELNLPEARLADQNVVLAAVQAWFASHSGWLLVVDNAENLPSLKPLLPSLAGGRLLLTTRERAMGGVAQRVEVERLDEATGALLLLRRAGKLAPDAPLEAVPAGWQSGAKAVSVEVDGLPLALDQAGAYLETRGVTPQQYLVFYRQRRQELHADYANPDHVSVSVTFWLALERVEQTPKYGQAAAQLARLCAFLAADAIPEEIFSSGASRLGEPLCGLAGETLEWTEVCAGACRYGLLRRESEPASLGMHRLAQEVVRDSLSEQERKETAERVVLAVNAALPKPDFPNWPLCARLLPHALVCAQHIADHGFRTAEAARLLNNTARYLLHHARYAEAEPLFVEALAIRSQVHGREHPEVAIALNNLGLQYWHMGRYDEAVTHMEEAVAIASLTLGEDDANYATDLDNLALVYHYQSRYEEAGALHEQALDITRQALGAEHPSVAIRLNNLALVYSDTGRYAEAETLLKETLEISRKTLGEDHPDYATCLLNLAILYAEWDRPAEAEPLLRQALSIREQALGPEHPVIASCYFWLGRARWAEDRFVEAADCFRLALEIWERALGPQHPNTVNTRAWLEGAQRRLASGR
jgi:tetratricopeptide (TPR) repeat protein